MRPPIRPHSFICLCGLFALPATGAGLGEPAERVLAAARAYVGEEDVLRAVDSIRYRGTFQEGEDGPVADITIVLKKPLNQRLELVKDGVLRTHAISGYLGWKRIEKAGEPDSWEMHIMKVDELKRMRANTLENLNFYSGIERLKGEIIDGGKVEYEGVPAHLLEFRYAENIFYRRYFDLASGRLLATEAEGGVVITEDGEQVVSGIRFPRKLVTRRGGKVVTVVVFKAIEVNPEIDDALFELPSLIPGKRD